MSPREAGSAEEVVPERGDLLASLPPPPEGKTGWPWTEGAEPLPPTRADDSTWPRITVVTPSYNQGRFIEATLRSVLLQGYPKLEYLVMDGGSTDETPELLRKYDPWLSGWRSGPDEGQSDAINRGWRRAKGEIVAWLNSDDVYHPGTLARAAETFARRPRAGLVYARSAVCGEDGEPTGERVGRPFAYDELLRGRCPVSQPSSFQRKSVLERTGLLDATLDYVMDWELWLRMAREAEVVFVDEVWSDFRLYSDSKCGAGDRTAFHREMLAVLERRFAEGSLPAGLARESLALARLRVAEGLYRRGDDREARRRAVRALRLSPGLLVGPETWRRAVRCLVGSGAVRGVKALLTGNGDRADGTRGQDSSKGDRKDRMPGERGR